MTKRADIDPTDVPDTQLQGRPFPLPDELAHYLRDVLRMSVGDWIELFDGEGRVLEGPLQQVDQRRVVMVVKEDRLSLKNESPCSITLYQAIPKGKRWRWLLEKATELGVKRIVPVETARTVVTVPEDRVAGKLERWEKVVASAARQSERAQTPDVVAPVDFDEALAYDAAECALVPWAGGEVEALDDILAEQGGVEGVDLWIGPEGGFADDEVERLRDNGVLPCRLGPRVLRTETAAIVATALIQNRLGDLSSVTRPTQDRNES